MNTARNKQVGKWSLLALTAWVAAACGTASQVAYSDGDDMYFSKGDRVETPAPPVRDVYFTEAGRAKAAGTSSIWGSGQPLTAPNSLAAKPATSAAADTGADEYYKPNYQSQQYSASGYQDSRLGRTRTNQSFDNWNGAGCRTCWGNNRFYNPGMSLGMGMGNAMLWGNPGGFYGSPMYDPWGTAFNDPFFFNGGWGAPNGFGVGIGMGNGWGMPLNSWYFNSLTPTMAGYNPYMMGYYQTYGWNPYAPYPRYWNTWNSPWGWGGGWNNGWGGGWQQGGGVSNGGTASNVPEGTYKAPGGAPGAGIIGPTPVNTPYVNGNNVGGVVTTDPNGGAGGSRVPVSPAPTRADVIDLNATQANRHSVNVVNNGDLVVPAQPGSGSGDYLVRPASSMIKDQNYSAFSVPSYVNGNVMQNNAYAQPNRNNARNSDGFWRGWEGGSGSSGGGGFGGFSSGGGGSVGGASPNIGGGGGGR